MGHEGSLYIRGEWTAPSAGGSIDVISPHTKQVIARGGTGGGLGVDC